MPAPLRHLFRRLGNRLRATLAPVPDIDAPLWLKTLSHYRFLAALPAQDQA